MPVYKITVSFEASRKLNEAEMWDLVSAVAVQVEEPMVRETDENSLETLVKANYETGNVFIEYGHEGE